MKLISAILATATLALAAPSAAFGQDTVNDTVPVVNTPVDEDDELPVGLLGLLGLAGLLGLKRKDDHRVHTDNRPR